MRYRLGLAAFLLAALAPVAAQAAEKITFGIGTDASTDAATYALTSGKIKDPNLDFTIDMMPYPRLAQATMTRQYNVTENSILGVPLMIEVGIPVKIIATSYRYRPTGRPLDLWVLKDSPYQKVADLKGKKIATASLEGGGTVSTREIMGDLGMNAALIGGDVTWVQLPFPQIEPALQSGSVDAALITNAAAYGAANNPKYRSVLQGSAELNRMMGGPLPSVVIMAYSEDLDKRPDAYAAFAKLLRASAQYTVAHPDEVFGEVAPKYKMDPAALKDWFQTFGSMPMALGPTDKAVMMKAWQAGAAFGALKAAPKNIDDVVWSRAITE